LLLYYYERDALERMVNDALGDKLFGDSIVRLCVPAFEGKHSEVFVFKTPHHPDYKFDRFEPMVKVALATSAAPTYFRPLEHNGYTLVDGGIWANKAPESARNAAGRRDRRTRSDRRHSRVARPGEPRLYKIHTHPSVISPSNSAVSLIVFAF
jgi:patatin-like phospholipase/acyl hydrolase